MLQRNIVQGYSIGVFNHKYIDATSNVPIEEKCIIFGILNKGDIYMKAPFQKQYGRGGASVLSSILVLRNGLQNPSFNCLTSPFVYFEIEVGQHLMQMSYSVDEDGNITLKQPEKKSSNKKKSEEMEMEMELDDDHVDEPSQSQQSQRSQSSSSDSSSGKKRKKNKQKKDEKRMKRLKRNDESSKQEDQEMDQLEALLNDNDEVEKQEQHQDKEEEKPQSPEHNSNDLEEQEEDPMKLIGDLELDDEDKEEAERQRANLDDMLNDINVEEEKKEEEKAQEEKRAQVGTKFYTKDIGTFISHATLLTVISAEYTPPETVRDMIYGLSNGMHFKPMMLEFLKTSDPIKGPTELSAFVTNMLKKPKNVSTEDVKEGLIRNIVRGSDNPLISMESSVNISTMDVLSSSFVRGAFKSSDKPTPIAHKAVSTDSSVVETKSYSDITKFLRDCQKNYDQNMISLLNIDPNMKLTEFEQTIADCYSFKDSVIRKVVTIYVMGMSKMRMTQTMPFVKYIQLMDDINVNGRQWTPYALEGMNHPYRRDLIRFLENPINIKPEEMITKSVINSADNLSSDEKSAMHRALATSVNIEDFPCKVFESYTGHHFIHVFNRLERILLKREENLMTMRKNQLMANEQGANDGQDVPLEEKQRRIEELGDKLQEISKAYYELVDDYRTRSANAFGKYVMMKYVKKLQMDKEKGSNTFVFMSPTSLNYSFGIEPEQKMFIKRKPADVVRQSNGTGLNLFFLRKKNIDDYLDSLGLAKLKYFDAIKMIIDSYLSLDQNMEFDGLDYFKSNRHPKNQGILKSYVVLWTNASDDRLRHVNAEEKEKILEIIEHYRALQDNNDINDNNTNARTYRRSNFIPYYPRLIICSKTTLMRAECLKMIWNKINLKRTTVVPMNSIEMIRIYGRSNPTQSGKFDVFDHKFIDYIKMNMIDGYIRESKSIDTGVIVFVKSDEDKNAITNNHKNVLQTYLGGMRIVSMDDIHRNASNDQVVKALQKNIRLNMSEEKDAQKYANQSKEIEIELYTGLTRLAISGTDDADFKVGVKIVINSLQEFSIDELMTLGLALTRRKFNMQVYEQVMDGTFQFFDWIRATTMTTHTLFNCTNEIDDRFLPFLYANKTMSDTLASFDKEYGVDNVREKVVKGPVKYDEDEDEFFDAIMEESEVSPPATAHNQNAPDVVNPFVGYDAMAAGEIDYLAVDVEWKKETMMELIDDIAPIIQAPNNFNELAEMLKTSRQNNERSMAEKTKGPESNKSDLKEFMRMKLKGVTGTQKDSKVPTDQVFSDCIVVAPTKQRDDWRQLVVENTNKEQRNARLDEVSAKIMESYANMSKITTWFNIRDSVSLKNLKIKMSSDKSVNVLIDEQYWMEHGNIYDVARLAYIMSFNRKAKIYLVRTAGGPSNPNRGQNGTEKRLMSFIYKSKNIKPSLLKNLL